MRGRRWPKRARALGTRLLYHSQVFWLPKRVLKCSAISDSCFFFHGNYIYVMFANI